MKFKQRLLSGGMLVMRISLVHIVLSMICVCTLYAKDTNYPRANKQKNTSLTKQEDIVITGKIYDESNLPLPGALISEKGKNTTAVTDLNGFFTIKVSGPQAVLVIKSLGFIQKEIVIGKQKTINISLETIVNNLKDVVVVGYGVQKKATATGAQSSLDGKALVQSPVANISNSLVGRVAGLSAVQASGEPGKDQSTIRIRGIGTFNGSQEPLILVDGIQVDNYNNLDPNEIENVTILKDASSTAVYGIRGANGVIIISTKSGKIGKPTVSYSSNYGINSFTDIRENMNSFDYANSYNQAVYNDAYIGNSQASVVNKFSPSDLAKYKSGEDPIFFPNVNWYDQIFKKSTGQQQHNLNFRGGTEKVKYFISAGLFDQEGLFNNTAAVPGFDAQLKYKRYNFRSNLDFDVTKKLKIELKVSSQSQDKSGPNIDRTETIIDDVLRATPLSSPGLIDGKVVILGTNAGENPFNALFSRGYKNEFNNTLNGSFRLEHSLDFITKGLSTHGELAYTTYNSDLTTYARQPVIFRALRGVNGEANIVPLGEEEVLTSYSRSSGKRSRTTAEFALDYNRTFKNHAVTALALYNQIRAVDPSYFELVPSTYQSVVGRTTYAYKSKYLAELNVAYNGSENFAPGKRFGVFPSYSLGWVPTLENFFPKNNIISFLKIRGSYGEVGNDQIGNNFLSSGNRFLFRPTVYTSTGGYYEGDALSGYRLINGRNGLREGRLNNPNLTWERAIKSNIGLDAYLYKDKVSLTFDLFQDKRDNILATINNITGNIGVQGAPSNFGKMKNKGFEVDLGFNDSFKDFKYYFKGNYSFARNKILEQDEITKTFGYQYRTNNSFGQYFGLIADGFYNSWAEVNDVNRPVETQQPGNRLQPGDVKYRDINGDGIINFDDEVPIGYSNVPEIIYGLTLGGSYKGFDVSALLQGADHVSVEYTRRTNQAFFDPQPTGAVATLIESWTPERYAAGLPINFPRFAIGNNATEKINYRRSTLNVKDASYLRLKNIEIGYTLKSKVFDRIGLRNTRFYVNGNNLITWTNLVKGIDPENPNLGANLEPYPLVKTINFGVNINF